MSKEEKIRELCLYYYESLDEVINQFFIDINPYNFNALKTLEFFVTKECWSELLKIPLGATILGRYYFKELSSFRCKYTEGFKIHIELEELGEYEYSKIEIYDLFVKIEGTGINKYSIDKIYPDNIRDNIRDKIRIAIIHKDPNKSIWINYKTKRTRDKDFQKLLELKDNS